MKAFYLTINTGKLSQMSQVSIPEAVSSGIDMEILSISVAELATILVGCVIIGNKQIVCNLFLKSSDVLCRKLLLKSPHMFRFYRSLDSNDRENG